MSNQTGKYFYAGLAVTSLLAVLAGCTNSETTSTNTTAPGGGSAKPGRPLAGSASAVKGPCGDERDTLIQAYKQISLTLNCNDFTRVRHTQYFSFSQLADKGGYQWALLRDPLLISKDKGYGLDLIRDNYAADRQIASAYRDPVHNKAVGGAPRSRHLFGDAADIRNVTRSREEWDRMWTAAQKAEADYIEPLNGPCQLNCLHADWRNHEGDYNP